MALKKEYGGQLPESVFNEVDRPTFSEDTKVVLIQPPFNIKAYGAFKIRTAVGGDLTVKGEHCLEAEFWVVSLENIRMIVAPAAGSVMPLISTY